MALSTHYEGSRPPGASANPGFVRLFIVNAGFTRKQDIFRAGLFEYGVIKGIQEVSRVLAQHFPKEPGGTNELSDAPVVL